MGSAGSMGSPGIPGLKVNDAFCGCVSVCFFFHMDRSKFLQLLFERDFFSTSPVHPADKHTEGKSEISGYIFGFPSMRNCWLSDVCLPVVNRPHILASFPAANVSLLIKSIQKSHGRVNLEGCHRPIITNRSNSRATHCHQI